MDRSQGRVSLDVLYEDLARGLSYVLRFGGFEAVKRAEQLEKQLHASFDALHVDFARACREGRLAEGTSFAVPSFGTFDMVRMEVIALLQSVLEDVRDDGA